MDRGMREDAIGDSARAWMGKMGKVVRRYGRAAERMEKELGGGVEEQLE